MTPTINCPNCHNADPSYFHRIHNRHGDRSKPLVIDCGKTKCLRCGFVVYDNAGVKE